MGIRDVHSVQIDKGGDKDIQDIHMPLAGVQLASYWLLFEPPEKDDCLLLLLLQRYHPFHLDYSAEAGMPLLEEVRAGVVPPHPLTESHFALRPRLVP